MKMSNPLECYSPQQVFNIYLNILRINLSAYNEGLIADPINKWATIIADSIQIGVGYLIKDVSKYFVEKKYKSELKNWFSDSTNPYAINARTFNATNDGSYLILGGSASRNLLMQQIALITGGTNTDIYKYINQNYFLSSKQYKYKIGTDATSSNNVATSSYQLITCILPLLTPEMFQVRTFADAGEFERKDFLFGRYNKLYIGSFFNQGTDYSPQYSLGISDTQIEYDGFTGLIATNNLAPIYFSFKIPNGNWLTITIAVNQLPMIPLAFEIDEVFARTKTVYGFTPIYYDTFYQKYMSAYYADFQYKFPTASLIDNYGDTNNKVNTYMSNLVTALNYLVPINYLSVDDTTNQLKIPELYIKRANSQITQLEVSDNIPNKTGWDKLKAFGAYSNNKTLPAVYIEKLNSIPQVNFENTYQYATFIQDYRVSEISTSTSTISTGNVSSPITIEIDNRNIYYNDKGQKIPDITDCMVPIIASIRIKNWYQNPTTINKVIKIPGQNIVISLNQSIVPLII